MTHKSMAFGRIWESDCPLHAFSPLVTGSSTPTALEVRRADGLAARGDPVLRSGNGALHGDGLRLTVRDVATFDIFTHGRIDWVPGCGWRDEFPPEMFSVIAATSLAMLGDLPLHGSAVELNGKGVLLCGAGGGGKSTIAAALCGIGARLVSDDLTVLRVRASGAPVMHLGKRSVRLFPEVARSLVLPTQNLPHCPRGKVLAYPATVEPDRAIPLHCIVMLQPWDGESGLMPEASLPATLLRSQFRPNWMRHLPGAASRLAVIDKLAQHAKVLPYRTRPIPTDGGLTDIAREVAELVDG